MMYEARFNCEVVTPMFMGNAQQNETEIRPSSIVGLMRFWWRAMNAELAQKGIDHLAKAEEDIFGGVGEGSRSSFDCWVEMNEEEERKTLSKPKYGEGIEYLFYILVNQNDEVKGFQPSTKFDLIFISDQKENFQKALACFWLATYFGGFGTRSRRGAGSITVLSYELIGIDLAFSFNIDVGIKNFLHQNYESIKSVLKEQIDGKVNNDYSHFSGASIFLSEEFPSWKAALNNIGQLMHSIRYKKIAPEILNQIDDKLNHSSYQKRGKDYDIYSYSLYSMDEKAAFGMPITLRNNVGSLELIGNDDINHRSSPLVISCIKLGEKKYHWTVLSLQGDFMPPGTKIIFNVPDPNEFGKGKFKISDEKREFLKEEFSNVGNVVFKYFLKKIQSQSQTIKL